jgi:DNA-binding GntR family transcriptional regulator
LARERILTDNNVPALSEPRSPLLLGTSAQEPTATLAERLFQTLTDAIMQGELPLGSKISEPALARRYGVSRGPLREALHRLQERKLITRSANHGARVIERTPQALYELFVVREALEGIAVREAVLRCSEDDLAALHDSVLRHEAEVRALSEYEPHVPGSPSHDFHFLIAHASRNPFLITLLCSELYPLLRVFRAQANESRERREQSVMEHKRILTAMQERDAELAEILVRRHIAAARRSREVLFPPNSPSAEPVPLPRPRRRSRNQ